MTNAPTPDAAAAAIADVARVHPLAHAQAQQPAPTLDAGALAKLRELDPDGRMAIVERVLTMFEPSLQRLLLQLQAQRGQHNPAAVADLAHGLKASSASVGALALAVACADVDRRLRAGTPGDLQADIERLTLEAGHALVAVRAMLNA